MAGKIASTQLTLRLLSHPRPSPGQMLRHAHPEVSEEQWKVLGEQRQMQAMIHAQANQGFPVAQQGQHAAEYPPSQHPPQPYQRHQRATAAQAPSVWQTLQHPRAVRPASEHRPTDYESSFMPQESQSNASRTPRARRTTCKRRSLSEAAEEGGGKQSVSLTRAGSTGSIDSSADSTSVTEKKSRFVWEPEVHKRFCEAVHKLGVLAAKPQAIAQLMQMEGPGAPTRQNIKSHLQKYRIYLAKQKHMGDPATSLAAVKSPQEMYDAPQRVDSEEDPIVASFGK
ncbi:MAG: hypothetical protein SGPRY_000367 [Prymnesium sp.]